MNRLNAERARRKPNRVRLQAELLEDRCTPACIVTQTGDLVTITGDATNNFITITDTGTGAAGNITIACDADPVFVSDAVTAIRRISFNTGVGNDAVTYLCTSTFNGSMSLSGNQGDGNDVLAVRVTGLLSAGSRMSFQANGGNGNDVQYGIFTNSLQAGASLAWNMNGEANNDIVQLVLQGSLFAGARLSANVDLGSGDDGWDALVQGNVFNGSLVTMNAFGGLGNDAVDSTFRTDLLPGSSMFVNYNGGTGIDNVRINSGGDVDVDVSATLAFFLNGGADNDNVFLLYGGRMNGTFNAILDGDVGNDAIQTYQFLNPGSTPTRTTFVSRTLGGEGNDNIQHYVKPNTFTSSRVNARLIAGNGIDTCQRSPNVSVSGCESDRLR